MNLLNILIRPLLCALICLLPGLAKAQFVGDIFFVVPAISIPKGGTGDLTIALFSGDKAFGATSSTITYDPNQLEIVSVDAVPSGIITPTLKWEASSGVIKLVVINGQSLAQPIGSVSLAKLNFRAIGATGVQAKVTSAVKSSFASDRTVLRVGTAYVAEVSIGTVMPSGSVTPGVSTLSLSSSNIVASTTDPLLQSKALSMRPAGHRVKLLVPTGSNGQFAEAVVQAVDANVPKESSSMRSNEPK